MSTALVIEDGTGIVGANSFTDVAYVLAYLTARGIGDDFAGATPAQQEACLISAGDYLKNERRFVYRGQRVTWNQGMPYPRTGVTMFRGPAVPNNVVPPQFKDAQAELCARALTNGTLQPLQPDLERGGAVQEETVDVITTKYFESASAETVISAVSGLLQPFLVSPGVVGLEPDTYYTAPAITYPFNDTDFRSPTATTPFRTL